MTAIRIINGVNGVEECVGRARELIGEIWDFFHALQITLDDTVIICSCRHGWHVGKLFTQPSAV